MRARTPSKIYVAGATMEVERVRTVQGYVRTAGHEVTFDWTAGIEAATVPEADMYDEHARTLAWRCLDGVNDADVVVFCAPKFQPPRHVACAWVEFGYAVAQKRGIVVLGEAGRQSIFCRLGHSFVRDDWQVALGIEDALLYRGK